MDTAAEEINKWKTEYDVVSTLRAAGHDVHPLGVQEEIKPVRDEIEGFKPHVVFTLLEEFHYQTAYDQHIASFLELMKVLIRAAIHAAWCWPRGKDLSKMLVHHRRIAVPAFAVFPMRQKVKRPPRLALPLIVKSLNEDGSFGISQASIVDTDEKLTERVAFIHERIETAAIAEQFIEGRELYVGVLGNNRLKALPVWELQFGSMGGARQIATEKVKHDTRYQERVGIVDGPAEDLAPELADRIQRTAKRIYRTLGLDGTRASTFASRQTARRISLKPIPIPKSRRARNSRPPRCMTASITRISCIALWRSALDGRRRGCRWVERPCERACPCLRTERP